MTHSVHPTAGGTTKYFFEVTQEIKRQGHHVTLVCTDEASSKNIEVDDLIFVKQIPIPILRYLIQTILFGLLAFLEVRGRDFDVYCFESGYVGLWLALFKLRKKGRLVSFSMRYGWKTLMLNLRNAYNKMRLGLLPYWTLYIPWEIIFFINEVLDVHLCDRVVVLSNEAKKVWVNKGIAPAKIEVIPYGVNLETYKPAAKDKELLHELGLREQDKIVLYVGHLDPVRNVDRLIPAFAIIRRKCGNSEIGGNLRFLIVGSGPSEKFLKESVDRLGLQEHVRFIAHIYDEVKLNKIYNLGDLIVLPQVPGTVSIQAMACGVPVVTVRNTKLQALAAIDDRMLSGFHLIDSADSESIAEACCGLFNNPERLNDMRQNGLRIVADYSWQNISARLLLMLQSISGKLMVAK
jgi:glycosyltransferase involved in cell wall biosynthesis